MFRVASFGFGEFGPYERRVPGEAMFSSVLDDNIAKLLISLNAPRRPPRPGIEKNAKKISGNKQEGQRKR